MLDDVVGDVQSAGLASIIQKGLPGNMKKKIPKETEQGKIDAMKLKIQQNYDMQKAYTDGFGNLFLERYSQVAGVDLTLPKTNRRMSRRISAGGLSEDNKAVMQEHWEPFAQSEQFTEWAAYKCNESTFATDKDFVEMRALGKGAFGAVFLVFNKYSGQGFATKMMKKKMIKEKGNFDSVKVEKEVLSKCESKFLVNLHYSYMTDTHVCLVLNLMAGGDCAFLLKQYCSKPGGAVDPPGGEEGVKFYTVSMALGLQDLHDSGFVYLDLKPANVLLNEKGYVRISDMGLTYDISGGPSKRRAGSPGYWPPEVINQKPYTTQPDWWSLGATVYAMMTDQRLFKNDEKTLDPDHIKNFEWANSCTWSPEIKDFIQQLCTIDMEKRITSVSKMLDHPWLRGFDVAGLNANMFKPPITPDVNNLNCPKPEEIGDFGKVAEDVPYDKEDDKMWSDWSYTNPALYANEMSMAMDSKKGGSGGGGGGGCCTIS